MSNMNVAMNAYQQALDRIGSRVNQQSQPAQNINSDFKNMVKEAVVEAVDISKNAEQISINAIAGKADIQDVVLAVSNAEVALETVVAVRDTAIKAYKEIMSMPM